MFVDRTEAGRRLAAALGRFRGAPVIVLALPRGGVPVAFEVARALGAPLDLVMVRKIGAPHQPELAIGAVADGARPDMVLNEDVVAALGVGEAYIEQEKARQLAEIERRRKVYLGHARPAEVKGRTAIIVDDGIATGATVRAAVGAVRKAGAGRVVIATPVAPPDTVAALARVADEVVCLDQPLWFAAIGQFYRDFRQLDDEEVIALLDAAGVTAKDGEGTAG